MTDPGVELDVSTLDVKLLAPIAPPAVGALRHRHLVAIAQLDDFLEVVAVPGECFV